MSTDLTHMIDGKRGDEFVATVQEIAILASASGGTLRCGTCPKPANWIGMQACGAPGGLVCDTCLQNHRDWINTWDSISEARPYCRHCGNDVGRGHVYAASLYDSTAAKVEL